MLHAVSTLHACSGTAPMNSASAALAYGIRASSTVADAPGTVIRSANNNVPPPVTVITPLCGDACRRSTSWILAFTGRCSFSEEAAHDPQEFVGLVVVHPMAGARDVRDAYVFERFCATVFFGDRRPGFR